jgi:hypothetical protein
MLYTVLIAVCLAATPAKECRKETAVDWVIAPEQPPTITGCMMHGTLYAASSHLVGEGSYAKVFCTVGAPRGGVTATRLLSPKFN